MDGLASAAEPAVSLASAGGPSTLFGYDVLECLGHGAGSVVWAVSQPSSGQVFALKQVVRQNPKDERFVEQLTNEYTLSRQFRHPGLRRCTLLRLKRDWSFKVCEAALMMDLIDGAAVGEMEPLSVPDAVRCLVQTAQALQVLHQMGYVHCDLKPGNIMQTATGEARVIDFGQTCRVGTIKQRIQGTLNYIAQEQVRRQPVSVQTDVFSFGATMYWILTRQNIPTAGTLNGQDPMILAEQRFASPHALRGEIPVALSDLIMRCLRLVPSDRPRDMGEILDQVQRIYPDLV